MSRVQSPSPSLPGTVQHQEEMEQLARAQSFNPQTKDLSEFKMGRVDAVRGVSINRAAEAAGVEAERQMIEEGIAPERRSAVIELVKHSAIGRAGAERAQAMNSMPQPGVIVLDQPVAQAMPNATAQPQAIAQPMGQPIGLVNGQPLAQPISQGQFVPAFQMQPNRDLSAYTTASSRAQLDAYRRQVSERELAISA